MILIIVVYESLVIPTDAKDRYKTRIIVYRVQNGKFTFFSRLDIIIDLSRILGFEIMFVLC